MEDKIKIKYTCPACNKITDGTKKYCDHCGEDVVYKINGEVFEKLPSLKEVSKQKSFPVDSLV